MSSTHSPTRLSLDRLAFYRAWMEGTMDLRAIAQRYLETRADLPAAKRTLKAIEKALVLACLRQGRPSDARLIRLDSIKLRALAQKEAQNQAPEQSVETFEQYRQRLDPHGAWSDSELYEQYKSEHGDEQAQQEKKENRRADRASRLIKRRNALLLSLQQALQESPKGEHDVRGWLDESLSSALWAAGLTTLDSVVQYANTHGHYWYRSIPRLGATKAARIVEFLQRNEDGFSTPLTEFALLPPRQYSRKVAKIQLALNQEQANSNAPAIRVRPSFYPAQDGLYVPPEQLDGSQGVNRAPLDKNRSGARNDYEAIQQWLNTFNEPHQRHTQRNYRKEAERLLLWAVCHRGIAFSDMTSNDVMLFRQFLADPQPHDKWVSNRSYERTHPEWRPFVWRKPPLSKRALPGQPGYGKDPLQAGLSKASVNQAISVCRSLCSWLVGQRYLDYNPFLGMSKKNRGISVDTTRSLTLRQWNFAMRVLNQMDLKDIKTLRLRFVLRLAYSTGLRLSEMVNGTTTDKIYVEEDVRSIRQDAYFLRVLGKGDVERSVPLTRSVRLALADYLQARGLSSDPRQCPPGTPLIAKLYETKHGWGLTPQALYQILSDFFRYAASQLPQDENYESDYRRFYQASTHWLRHTYGTHALAYGADLNVVQGNLGHKSLSTTSLYTRAEKRLQHEQMEAFDEASTAQERNQTIPQPEADLHG